MTEIIDTYRLSIYTAVFVFIGLIDVVVMKLLMLIVNLFTGRSAEQRKLEKEKGIAESELRSISMVDQFVIYARKKREIIKLDQKISALKSAKLQKKVTGLFVFGPIMLSIIIGVGVYILWSTYGMGMFAFPTSWFYPLNGIMAWPGLAVTDSESPVSATFLMLTVLCFCRILK